MALPATRPTCTPDEYLALERQAEVKSEYIDGTIVAMSGDPTNRGDDAKGIPEPGGENHA